MARLAEVDRYRGRAGQNCHLKNSVDLKEAPTRIKNATRRHDHDLRGVGAVTFSRLV